MTGDGATAARLTEGIARWALPRRAQSVAAYAHHVELMTAVGQGDFEVAFHHANAISPAGEFAPYAWLAPTVSLDLVESAVRTGRHGDAAVAHVAAMEEARLPAMSPRLAMLFHAASALVAEGPKAPAHFTHALAVPGADGYRFDVARVRLLYGSHFRRHQAVAESRSHLRLALAAFEALDAAPWTARARAELSATAQTRATARARTPRALTPQEQQIAELAASGLTNKKIAEKMAISHRTVGNHLYQIYPKLGVASRGGLRDALRAQPGG
ncbi:regulatory protein, luxR family [Actinacidiphila rubida]|uniref:Regulatory protein, luxR family n=1 Tax=Actinacidiphila rubida TaxID=310780 RepID=A0A1H8QKX3_9ACTN|nr:regulatory protein, luxR family [Actinacidiphila rubida]